VTLTLEELSHAPHIVCAGVCIAAVGGAAFGGGAAYQKKKSKRKHKRKQRKMLAAIQAQQREEARGDAEDKYMRVLATGEDHRHAAKTYINQAKAELEAASAVVLKLEDQAPYDDHLSNLVAKVQEAESLLAASPEDPSLDVGRGQALEVYSEGMSDLRRKTRGWTSAAKVAMSVAASARLVGMQARTRLQRQKVASEKPSNALAGLGGRRVGSSCKWLVLGAGLLLVMAR
jgi:hypothetical protein